MCMNDNPFNVRITTKQNSPKSNIEDTLENNFITRFCLNSKYISDGIGEEYMNWAAQNPVFISAQTGTGKNTFIENTLIKYASSIGEKVLIVTNRIANNLQQKERIADISGCSEYLDDFTSRGLYKIENFKNVKIITYQKLESYLENNQGLIKLENYHFVVMDEVHFFISDALFNNKTGKILKKSLLAFKNSVRIYMSATPDEILPVITQKISDSINSHLYFIEYFEYYRRYGFLPIKSLLLYDFKRDYSYVNSKYFDSKDQIVDIIKKDNSDSKWLIFVANKKCGEDIANEIGKNAIFITANSKVSNGPDGKAYEEITKTEKFSNKVLICTSVLDNGINFKDELLKNIIIFTCDKTEFLQMLGRKRRINNENITLYICARNISYFNEKLYVLRQQANAINYYKNSPIDFTYQYNIGSSIGDVELFSGLFYIELIKNHFTIQVNELAQKKIANDMNFYKNIIDKFKTNPKEAFILEQLSWMSLEKTYTPCSWVTYADSDKNKREFLEFLDNHCDVELSGKVLEEFQINFKVYVNKIYGKQPGDRSDRTNYKATKMRSFFKTYSLNYIVQVKNKAYILKKV